MDRQKVGEGLLCHIHGYCWKLIAGLHVLKCYFYTLGMNIPHFVLLCVHSAHVNSACIQFHKLIEHSNN